MENGKLVKRERANDQRKVKNNRYKALIGDILIEVTVKNENIASLEKPLVNLKANTIHSANLNKIRPDAIC